MKLVIIGNGFDLHHDLKTSFDNFRNKLRNSTDSEDKEIFDYVNNIIINSVGNLTIPNTLNWNDFERIMNSYFINMRNSDHTEIFLDKFEEEMARFSSRFHEYLKEECSSKKIKHNSKIAEEIKDADVLLVFNYTSTYTQYLNPEKECPAKWYFQLKVFPLTPLHHLLY